MPVLTQMPVLMLTRTPSYYFVNCLLIWLHLDVLLCSSYDLGIQSSLCCITFTSTDVGIAGLAAHLGSLLYKLGSVLAIWGLSPEKNHPLGIINHAFFSHSHYAGARDTTVQELPRSVDLVCSTGNLLVSLIVKSEISKGGTRGS
ncbi:uncharacterized protein HD556DRAFT_806345 [Suillus plorans]|uniref:Uncharacterized protein n=1 Tax=Suillus plorans TaxID=116603 RepID=A0A9P7J4D7_9AGAM|nr:uncharacterized protein HD556DRAFT_806345 [Suillus plorans]KAG1802227.1 hypothetical protein HD556DRAFT_806345 [Suillus plorans]